MLQRAPEPLSAAYPNDRGPVVNWITLVLVLALPTTVLVAWAMWLGFALLIAKWHGPDGLKAVRYVANGFRPQDWALLVPRRSAGNAIFHPPGHPPTIPVAEHPSQETTNQQADCEEAAN